jgi:hypothetical protein
MEPSTPHPGDIVSIRISGDFSAEWLHGVTAMYQVFEHSSWRGTAILIAEWSNRPRVIPLPYTGPIDLSLVGILPWVALKYQILKAPDMPDTASARPWAERDSVRR